MGVVANYPLAVASGMGLNAVVAFQLVVDLKLPWPAAMGVIFIEGLVIAVLVITGFREAVMNAIPLSPQEGHRRRHRAFYPLYRPFERRLCEGRRRGPRHPGGFNNIQGFMAVVGLFS